MRGRAPASDSVAGRIQAAQEKPATVPEDLEPLTDDEMAAFEQYGAFRGGWKAAELRGLHRAVKLESGIKRLVALSETVERYQENPNTGLVTTHPIFRDIRDEQKLLQSQLRMLGLNVTPEGRRRIANKNPPAPPNPSPLGLLRK